MKYIFVLIVASIVSLLPVSTHAVDKFWLGGSGPWDTTTATWGTNDAGPFTNTWANNTTDSAAFPGSASYTMTPGVNISLNKLTNNCTAGTLSIIPGVGTQVTFGGTTPRIHTATKLAFTVPIKGTGVTLTKSGAGQLQLNNNGQTLAKFIVNGGIISSANTNKYGSIGVGSAADAVTLDGGGIGIDSTSQLPGFGITVGAGGGSFGSFSSAITMTLNSKITGVGGVNFGGGAVVTPGFNAAAGFILANTNNDYAGSTTLSVGTLTLGASGVIPDTSAVTLSGGDWATGGFNETVKSIVLNSANSAISGTGTLTATNLPTSYTFKNGTCSSILAGSTSTALKNSANTVTLSGASTFNGGFTIGEGTLLVNNNAALGAANSSVIISNGITLSASSTTARTLNQAWAIYGDFTLGQASGGTANATLAGSLNLEGGTRTITVANPTNTISGIITNGGLGKAGSGVLLLTGANTYSGSTAVTAGKLSITPASTGGGSFSVADSASLGIPLTAVGASLAMSDLTIGTSTIEFDLAHLGLPASKVVNDTGAITVNGTVAVDVKGFDAIGSSTLLEYVGPRSGAGSFTTGLLPPRVIATIFDDTANNKVVLNATAADSLIWVGDAIGNWDINSGTQIWKLASDNSPTDYRENAVQGDTVRFDDTVVGTTTVNLTTILVPYRVTVDNTASNYTFAGTGKLSTTASLVKSGSGLLTILTTNDYTGGTTLSGGTVAVGAATAFGTGKLTLSGNAVIRSDTTAASGLNRTIAVAMDLGAALTLGDAVNDGQLTISGVLTNTGSITKVGNGTLDLSGANTFNGGFTLSAGTVRVNNNAALGLANSTVNLANGVTLATTTTSARTLTYAFNLNGDLTLGQVTGGTAAVTMAGTLNLGGATRTIVISNLTDTIIANISNGGITKNGTNTLILTGTNTYSGGTTVNDGVLQGSTSGLQGTIVNNGSLVFSQTTAGTNSSNISGTGTLTKSGSGNVTLAGTVTSLGSATITAGTLTINGSLASTNVTVSSGATLGGSGTVGGAVTISSGGTVGAGNSAGLLTITNGLDLTAGGTNLWELAANSTSNPGTDFDQIVLSGGNLGLGGTSRLLIKFIGTSTTPTNTDAFWQSPHSWKIVSLIGTGANAGSSNFFAIDGTNATAAAGTFSTAADGTGITLNFVPSGAAPQPVLSRTIVGAGTTNAQINFSSVNGTSYTLQFKSNLNQVGWLNLSNIIATGTNTSITDSTNPPPNERYYRVTSP